MNALQDMKDFEAAGFNKEQAEILAFKMHQSISENTATKGDLETAILKLENKIEKEIAGIRSEVADLRVELKDSINSLTWRFLGMLTGLAGVIIAMLKYFVLK